MTASVYVGTYAKYNNGSIAGAWVDLEQFSDRESFEAHIKALHSDESDPEFMFQDFEGFPSHFYNESWLDDELFDWLALGDSERAILEAYIDAFGDQTVSLETAMDSYCGQFDSDLDFAYEYIESTNYLGECSDSIANYFDYDKFSRDLMMDHTESNGHYFSNY